MENVWLVFGIRLFGFVPFYVASLLFLGSWITAIRQKGLGHHTFALATVAMLLLRALPTFMAGEAMEPELLDKVLDVLITIFYIGMVFAIWRSAKRSLGL